MGGDVDMDFQSMRGPPRRSIISPCFNCYVSFPVGWIATQATPVLRVRCFSSQGSLLYGRYFFLKG